MKLIVTLLISTIVFAEDKAPVDLVDHYNAMLAVWTDKTKNVDNPDKGYLVKIDGEKFFKKGPDYYVYQSQVRRGNIAVPVLLLASKEFDLEMERLSIYREKNYDNLKKLSKEGGGQFHGDPPQIPIYVLAKPKGRKDYIYPIDGSNDNAMAFEVMQICKNSSYKECRKIKTESLSSWTEKIFGK